uniref:Uncharacterized protein n=1 Tax=Anguilla anguilla TaxID=7936 RepID=A0A0E9SHH1_ANGAN
MIINVLQSLLSHSRVLTGSSLSGEEGERTRNAISTSFISLLQAGSITTATGG